jgi:hypothetical protein
MFILQDDILIGYCNRAWNGSLYIELDSPYVKPENESLFGRCTGYGLDVQVETGAISMSRPSHARCLWGHREQSLSWIGCVVAEGIWSRNVLRLWESFWICFSERGSVNQRTSAASAPTPRVATKSGSLRLTPAMQRSLVRLRQICNISD